MTNVNLLSYRVIDKRVRIAHMFYLAIWALLILIISFTLTYFNYMETLSDKQSEYSQLQGKNKKMSTLIGEVSNIDKLRSNVEAKLNLIDLLQKGRYYTFSKLSFISKSKPENLWITKLKDNGENINVHGYAMSSKDVSDFMRNLEGQDIFSKVSLSIVSKAKVGRFDSNVTFYNIVITQKYKDSDIKNNIDSQKTKHKKTRAVNK